MEQPDLQGVPAAPKCEWCGRPMFGQRDGARYCSRPHKNSARRARRRVAMQLSRYPSELTEHYDEAVRKFPDPGDIQGDADYLPDGTEGDEDGIFAGDFPPDEAGHDSAFAAQMRLSTAIEAIEERYAKLMKPFEIQLTRNPGVRPIGLARLERQRDAEIRQLLRAHYHAVGMERAARHQPLQQAQAEERRRGQYALAAFANDLPGGSGRYETPSWSGRGVHDVFNWS